MRTTLTRSTLAALTLTLVLGACGDRPVLEGIGDRSGEWIGPVVNGAVFLPSD